MKIMRTNLSLVLDEISHKSFCLAVGLVLDARAGYRMPSPPPLLHYLTWRLRTAAYFRCPYGAAAPAALATARRSSFFFTVWQRLHHATLIPAPSSLIPCLPRRRRAWDIWDLLAIPATCCRCSATCYSNAAPLPVLPLHAGAPPRRFTGASTRLLDFCYLRRVYLHHYAWPLLPVWTAVFCMGCLPPAPARSA